MINYSVDRPQHLRAVAYARYSLQAAASIEDQIRVCRERVDREAWTLLACLP